MCALLCADFDGGVCCWSNCQADNPMKINGGSVSESNRPEPGFTRLTPVLKTGRVTGPHALPRAGRANAPFYPTLEASPSGGVPFRYSATLVGGAERYFSS